MARRSAAPAPRILFRPKAVSANPAFTDAGYHGRVDTSRNIADALRAAARCKSADLVTPRRVSGESKAIKAEGYWAGWTKPLDPKRW